MGKGCLVVAPDYSEGDRVEELRIKPGFDLATWAVAKLSRAKELIPGWVAAVKAKYGVCVCNAFNLRTRLAFMFGPRDRRYKVYGSW